MWADWEHSPHRHYYIKELAQLGDSKLVIPMKWITIKGVVHVDVYDVAGSLQVGVLDIHEDLGNELWHSQEYWR